MQVICCNLRFHHPLLLFIQVTVHENAHARNMGCSGEGPCGLLPLSFFAVEPELAVGSDSGAPTRELRLLVEGLSEAGLSVICQVSFTIGQSLLIRRKIIYLQSSVYATQASVVRQVWLPGCHLGTLYTTA